jgi:hypothetical protein
LYDVGMTGLQALLMRPEPSDDGVQATVLLVEPSGNELQVRCLCRPDGRTELGVFDGPAGLNKLIESYGTETVVSLARQVTLATR